MNQFHTPVLLKETLTGLAVSSGAKYIDATLGGGGHTKAILHRGGIVLGIDRDQEALDFVAQRLNHPQLTTVKANFSQLEDVARQHHFFPVSGILFDLGASSRQLTSPTRGFSFNQDCQLDMRMDQELAVTAKDLLAALGKKELTLLFSKFADEPKAHQIAAKIVNQRKENPIATTYQLKHIIESVYPYQKSKIHPATRVFQALRIAVNDELNSLKAALPQALDLLEPGGRLAVISFHSGEDRIVKQFIKTSPELTSLTTKPITPSPEELSINPRSRSAKLRIAQKK